MKFSGKWDVVHFDVSGPVLRERVSAELLVEQLRSHVLSWADLAKPAGSASSKWRRFFELEELREAMPPVPLDLISESSSAELVLPPRHSGGAKELVSEDSGLELGDRPVEVVDLTVGMVGQKKAEWFVQFGGTEFGPFSLVELKRIIQSGKLEGEIYLWCDSLDNWMPLSAFPSLDSLVPSGAGGKRRTRRKIAKSDPELLRGRDVRSTGRQSLVATVAIADSNEILGVCANISEKGLQLLLDGSFEFPPDEILRLKICPIGITGLNAFVASVRLAWNNSEEGRAGFGFVEIGPMDQKALLRYLDAIRTRQFNDQLNRGQWPGHAKIAG